MNATYLHRAGYLAHVAHEELAARASKAGGAAKTVVAIASAPLAGLAFVIALPFVGLVAMLAWMGAALKNEAPGAGQR